MEPAVAPAAGRSDMTSSKQLKARVRARMARTGERYAVARMHVRGAAGGDGPVVDAGWAVTAP